MEKKPGFTLIEMLIVVAVLALIAGISITAITRKAPPPRPTYTVTTPTRVWHHVKPLWPQDSYGPYGHFADSDGREVRVFGDFIIEEEPK